MPEERCDRCRYWKSGDASYNGASHPNDHVGTCRLNPPVHLPSVVHLFVRDADKQYEQEHGEKMSDNAYCGEIFSQAADQGAWRQPTVTGEDWCGQFNPAPPAEDSE